jgi:hypothetical protein
MTVPEAVPKEYGIEKRGHFAKDRFIAADDTARQNAQAGLKCAKK